jgi:L-threonylcarbamoyladenylate synthase
MTLEYLRRRSSGGLLPLADLDRVAVELTAGGLAVLPTETGYMLAALATDEAAIENAFKVKGRDLAHTVHIACSSVAMARRYGRLNAVAERILGALTPGPVTVVVNQTSLLPTRLVTQDGTVGIRVPDHPITAQVVAAVGRPLTATSLNRAGEPPAAIAQQELETLNWPGGDTVYIVPDDSSIRYELPSTLVRVTGVDLEILRQGPVAEAELRDAIRLL